MKNSVSRRYMEDIEVTYLSPKGVDVRSMDEFVLAFLKRNVSILGRGK
ncbi:hypothetical protein JJB11_14290 [Ramlibacter ginsenosidimutans]|uniref:Uncharacterized protein n=1 Tax=Ramlibacter ginsenosidimutans TaxID=502333 RepID=A0A934WN35_9BURK|nr:hypothetical protein [Ramlibacter ginsenosidimutans]MBK6007266.1 hypothetical protein [Ramlibacter ginsenosidimutans]